MGGAGKRPREDEDGAIDNDVFGRLDLLANVLAETFPGYSPRYNKPT